MLDGKNNMSWSFHFRHYVEDKGMAIYLDGNTEVPEGEKGKSIQNTPGSLLDL